MRDAMDVPTGTHACCRFESAQQRERVIADYVADGLARRERVAVFCQRDRPPAPDMNDPKLAEALDSDQLLLGVAEDAYFSDGCFDGRTRVNEFSALAEESVSAGWSGLRVYADNGGMPAALSSPDVWLEYEMRVAATIPRFALTGLCGFSADDPPGLSIDLLDAVHECNVTPAPRPSAFHLRGRSDGSFALVGGLVQETLDNFRRLMSAAAPVLVGNYLSLLELESVDTPAARELHRLARRNAVTVWGIPPFLRRLWQELGLRSAD